MKILPDTDPKLFSLSAVVVGYLLIDDMSATEQNALGSWLMLVGQLVSTNAFYSTLKMEREKSASSNQDDQSTLEMLEKMIKALEKEVKDIKDNYKL